MTASPAEVAPQRVPARAGRGVASVLSVYRVERRKLSSQLAIRLLALICLIGPFVFAAILKVQNGGPTDTLYGVWVHSSGFAVSLVLAAFAGAWGLPLIAGIVAGDVFSAEDRYGTWKMVLTRSAARRDLFVGKVLAALTFAIGLALLVAVSSLVSGVLFSGGSGLVSLSGTTFSTARSLGLVIASWLLCLLPTTAFASLGILLSVATRNGIVGVIGPGLAALVMELLLIVGSGVWVHLLLVASAFLTWHALFTASPYLGMPLIGVAVSLVWMAACLSAAWWILKRRDFAGTTVSRRQDWVMPVRLVAALTVAIALLAIATNWGPVGVTPARLKASLIPAFDRLTILQQRELGRPVAPGAKLNIVLPTCSRRGSTPRGPGDWVCTINVLIPSSGSLPPQPTPVTYDVSVQWDGCYKAQSPPSFIGQQQMRDAQGHSVVNPLYTIYGCFNTL